MRTQSKRAVLAVLVLALAVLGGAGLIKVWQGTRAERVVSYRQDHVSKTLLKGVRLGDAVPLDVEVVVRWHVQDPRSFAELFPSPDGYAAQVLEPRAREAASAVAIGYPGVQAVFGADRAKFVKDVHDAVVKRLDEPGIVFKEVVIADITFPDKFTGALEAKALKEHELEGVRQENFVALERAKSAQAQAEADGRIMVAKAEAEGKVAEIAARTEEKSRVTALARAETESQVLERKAKAEAAKQGLLTEAEVSRVRKLGDADVEKQAKLRDVELEKARAQDKMATDRERDLASLCSSNPTYASFLVSKELASKVQIAVLPTGTDSGALGGLLHTMMPAAVRADKR